MENFSLPAAGIDSRKFMYMSFLQHAFNHPVNLLGAYKIPMTRRLFLLKRWRDDQTLFLAENCRDMDYLQDMEMEDLLWAVRELSENTDKYGD